MRRLKEPDPVFELFAKRTGGRPSCRTKCLKNACLLAFRFARAMRLRPPSVGALRTPFVQRQVTMLQFRFFVNEIQKSVFSEVDAGGLELPFCPYRSEAIPRFEFRVPTQSGHCRRCKIMKSAPRLFG
jgi:hypothetical protein